MGCFFSFPVVCRSLCHVNLSQSVDVFKTQWLYGNQAEGGEITASATSRDMSDVQSQLSSHK